MQNIEELLQPQKDGLAYETALENLYDACTVLDMYLYDALYEESFDAERAWDYLLDRMNATLDLDNEGAVLPLYELLHRLELNAFEFFCLLLSIAPYVHEKYELVLERLGCKNNIPTLALAEQLFSKYFPLDGDTMEGLFEESGAGRILFCFTSQMQTLPHSQIELTPNIEVLNLLLNFSARSQYDILSVNTHVLETLEKGEKISQFSPLVEALAEGVFTTLYESLHGHPKTVLWLREDDDDNLLSMLKKREELRVLTLSSQAALSPEEKSFQKEAGAQGILETACNLCGVGIKYLDCGVYCNFPLKAQQELLSALVMQALFYQYIICLDEPWEQQWKDVLFLLEYVDIIAIL